LRELCRTARPLRRIFHRRILELDQIAERIQVRGLLFAHRGQQVFDVLVVLAVVGRHGDEGGLHHHVFFARIEHGLLGLALRVVVIGDQRPACRAFR
jgi:hypothetical protein